MSVDAPARESVHVGGPRLKVMNLQQGGANFYWSTLNLAFCCLGILTGWLHKKIQARVQMSNESRQPECKKKG